MARRKPSVSIKKNKDWLEIITTKYDKFGRKIEKQIEKIFK